MIKASTRSISRNLLFAVQTMLLITFLIAIARIWHSQWMFPPAPLIRTTTLFADRRYVPSASVTRTTPTWFSWIQSLLSLLVTSAKVAIPKVKITRPQISRCRVYRTRNPPVHARGPT